MHRWLPWREADSPLHTHPHYVNQLERDLADRSRPGTQVFPICWVSLYAATSFAQDHAVVFWTSAVTGLLAVALRALTTRRRMRGCHCSMWRPIHAALSIALSLNWGLVLAFTGVQYGFQGTIVLLVTLIAIAVAAGNALSFFPDRRLARLLTICALGPAVFSPLFTTTRPPFEMSAICLAMLYFCWVQIGTINHSYWVANEEHFRAEAAARAKGAFLANMSHEIRTPLNGMMGMIELVLKSRLEEEQGTYLRDAYSASQALMRLLNDILDFSKIEAEQMSVESIEFRLEDVLRDVVSTFRLKAAEKGIELKLHASDNLPECVSGDPGRLRQVLFNLVGNAVKFTAHGSVTLRVMNTAAAYREPRVRFEVRDTGIGIAKDKQHEMFKPFSQADGATSRKFGGTGLGLAISSRLVKLMGGALEIESEEGVGSRFHFTLNMPRAVVLGAPVPLAYAQDAALIDGAAPEPRSLSVLLAEDNAINRRLVEAILRRSGHNTTIACDGAEAVAAYRASRFDIVLMDMQMPDMDGLQATREIRKHEAELGLDRVTVLALTANALPADREACLEAGMDGYLSKPLKIDELLNAITALAHRDATNDLTQLAQAAAPPRVEEPQPRV